MAMKKSIEIPEWLVLGSFPMNERNQGQWLKNGYRCEADFAPAKGETFDGRIWSQYEAGQVNFMDQSLPFEQRHWSFAYVATYVRSPKAQKVNLHVGSDDGVSIWLNGENIFFNDCQRVFDKGQDVVPMELKKGWNLLLCKVSQSEGEWLFHAALAAVSTRAPKPEVTFSVKKPGKKAFPGLAGRKNGLVISSGEAETKIQASEKEITLHFTLPMFNDSDSKAKKAVFNLADENGNSYGQAKVDSVEAFTSERVTIELEGEKFLGVIKDAKSLYLESSSSIGKAIIPLPLTDALKTNLFLLTMTGFDVPLEEDAEFTVPEVFRKVPAVVEVHTGEAHLPRDVAWPKLPSRALSSEETNNSKIKVGLSAPAGIPHVQARVMFGDEETQNLQSQVRFLWKEMKADLSGCEEAARRGLLALNGKDFAGATEALKEVHEALTASQPDIKNHEIYLIGHGHIDMNWLWTSWETMQCCHDTFRQVLSFMEEFPDFKYSQSQSSTYRYVEECDPELFKQIQKRVKEGRWELLGGCVDEGDTNMSSGEGIARALLLGQKYFMEKFGKRAVVGWNPDNFGHAAQLPQLLRLAGIKYFYAHRCKPRMGVTRWKGTDGSSVIDYTSSTYNGAVDSHLRHIPAEYDPKHKKMMHVYGVGDHGGGPSRQDITRAIALDDMPGFPSMKFATAEEFFEQIEPISKDYPQTQGELQYVFEGCYTSIARIKEGNRHCENTLYGGEMVAALMALNGFDYPGEKIEESWYTVAFNQFHDILCGSATYPANRESIAWYDAALALANDVTYSSLRQLASRVKTREDLGQPLVVFNSLGQSRTDIVESEVFSYMPPPTAQLRHWGHYHPFTPIAAKDIGQGPFATVKLMDESGKDIDAQIVDGKLFPNGYRLKVQFLAEEVPPCGVRTYYVRPEMPGAGKSKSLVVKDTTVETPYFKVQVDSNTGHVKRIYDKKRKKEVLKRGAPGNVLKIHMEAPHGMSAWTIGNVVETITLDEAKSVRVVEEGPVRSVIEIDRTWDRSKFKQRILIYKDLPRIDFELFAEWFQLGGPDKNSPMLRVGFPLNVQKGKYFCDTPYAAVERPTDGREVPAQKWTDLSGQAGGAAMFNDSKYGHRCDEQTLEMTLLRASYDPDSYPDQGPHHIRYSLFPHSGNWKRANLPEKGLSYNMPLLAIETPPSDKGDLAPGDSLMALEPANVQLSAVKKAEDNDDLIVRFFEATGKATKATLKAPGKVKKAIRVNLLEEELEDVAAAEAQGQNVSVSVKPNEVVTLRLKL